jgi:8-oxo-dGTP pyrophosphatase MutT (NUDIX family)
MNFEPEKFFIGLMDFFSILLPGALLTYFIQEPAGRLLLGPNYAAVPEVEGAVRFLFCSYLLGHFLFLAGSWIDPLLYDPLRKGTDSGQIDRLAKGKSLYPRWLRKLAASTFKYDDETLRRIIRIKHHYVATTPKVTINAFQWCKAHLTIEKPSVMGKVERFEADSKFFRSLAVVLIALLIFGTMTGGRGPLLILSAIGIVPALWRYVDQRGKSILQAYWYVLTLEGTRQNASKPASDSPAPKRAGGVVFRKRAGITEYLLVESSRKPRMWVLPKGHIEPNETANQTAVREVHEESGVWARVVGEIDEPLEYPGDGELVKVQCLWMEPLEEGKPEEPRKLDWFTLNTLPKELGAETRAFLTRIHRAS